MKILVANIGSTSFKFRLYDMRDERQLARGGIERIGDAASACFVEIDGRRRDSTAPIPDHGAAVRLCLDQLTDPTEGCLKDASEVAAIGFKAVHGGRFSGVQRVTPELLVAMEEMSSIAPAHNPPYIRAMRQLSEQFPELPLVAAFETGFHQTIPDRNYYYALPFEWSEEFLIKKWGFHGASHRYIARRIAELLGRKQLRVISCHLGGSSSLCASRGGESQMTSMGMSPQSGLPQNNRIGEFDIYALPLLMERTGKTLEQVLAHLANQGGLLGVSGVSGDMRDVEQAAREGNRRAQLALDVYYAAIRKDLGGMLVELGGADAIVFTGGIGENGTDVRTNVCRGLEELGIVLDEEKNRAARGECRISSDTSRVDVWVVPTNEELVVARQSKQLLESTEASLQG